MKDGLNFPVKSAFLCQAKIHAVEFLCLSQSQKKKGKSANNRRKLIFRVSFLCRGLSSSATVGVMGSVITPNRPYRNVPMHPNLSFAIRYDKITLSLSF